MFGVLRRNVEFRRIWLAQVVSEAGDWLNRIAILTLIGELGGARELGVLFGAELVVRLLPTAMMGPIAGPIADRVPRRTLMMAADLVRAGIVLLFLLVDGAEDLWLLYTLLVAQMSVSIFFQSARSASIPRTVPAEELHEAYAVTAATWSTMLSIGALVGGLLVRWVGTDGVFLCDAATYLVSASFLVRLDLGARTEHPERFSVRRILLLEDMRDGLRQVRERGLLWIVLAKSFWGGAGGYLVLLSLYGHRRFGDDEGASELALGTAVGLLYFARGIGTGIGPILARRIFGSSDRALFGQVAGGFAVGALGYACFAPVQSLWLGFACVVFAHLGGSSLWVSSTLLWQRKVEDRYRGRVYALEFLGMTLSFAAAGFLTGRLFDANGSLTHTTWSVTAAVVVLGAAWSFLARRGGLGRVST